MTYSAALSPSACYVAAVLFDCQACGACCCNTKKNVLRGHRAYIEILPSDVMFRERKDLLHSLAVIDDTGTYQMKLMREEQRCVALAGELGEKVRCEVYDFRPEGCRLVEPGDDECLKARRLHRPRLVDGEEPAVDQSDEDELF